MALIDVSHLSFAYEGSHDYIFKDVSFQIDTDWRLGFTGRNGRGKTTFLNLLLGRYEYTGSITAPVEFEYFPYRVPDTDMNTFDLIEYICPCVRWEVVRELNLLEVAEDCLSRAFYTLSEGERTKILLAALFLRENRFLLIDEPTNHLDTRGREIVRAYLNGKKGFILVSHDRYFLDGCVDHILSINRADIEIQKGNFSSWLVNRRRQDKNELDENERLEREIARLKKTSKQKSDWSDTAERRKIGFNPAQTEKSMGRRAYQGAKSKKLMRRAKAIETRLESEIAEKSKLLKNIETAEALKIIQPVYHSDRLVSLEEVSIYYGEKIVCRDVTFSVNRGDRVALTGPNGSGKSSLLRLILGEDIAYTGNFRRGSRLSVSYVSQDTSFLDGSLRDYAAGRDIDESLFLAILRKLDFSRDMFGLNMRDLSEGQKKKALIASSLSEKAHLLIWDEPLNFIDVISRIQIEELLLKYTPTILFVEHDRAFCENIATHTVRL